MPKPKQLHDPFELAPIVYGEILQTIGEGNTYTLESTSLNDLKARRLTWYRLRKQWLIYRTASDQSPQRNYIQSASSLLTTLPDKSKHLLTIGQPESLTQFNKEFEEKFFNENFKL